MLDIRRLRLLRELHMRGTLAAVAEAMAFTPSAVSQQLAQLQRDAGVQLLERAGRGVRLTSAARQLVNHTEAILEQLERAESELRASSGIVQGVLRVAAFQTAATSILISVLKSLSSTHADLSLELVEQDTGESIPALASGQLDLVIGNDYDHYPQRPYPGVVREELFYDPLLVALPIDHPLMPSSGRSIKLSVLRSERWATGMPGTGFGEVLPRACAASGSFHPEIVHRSDNFTLLAELVAHRQAVALLPSLGWSMAPSSIRGFPVAERQLGRRVFLATRRGVQDDPGVHAVKTAILRLAAKPGAAFAEQAVLALQP